MLFFSWEVSLDINGLIEKRSNGISTPYCLNTNSKTLVGHLRRLAYRREGQFLGCGLLKKSSY